MCAACMCVCVWEREWETNCEEFLVNSFHSWERQRGLSTPLDSCVLLTHTTEAQQWSSPLTIGPSRVEVKNTVSLSDEEFMEKVSSSWTKSFIYESLSTTQIAPKLLLGCTYFIFYCNVWIMHWPKASLHSTNVLIMFTLVGRTPAVIIIWRHSV